jgi:GT2 family glycosyltransferase
MMDADPRPILVNSFLRGEIFMRASIIIAAHNERAALLHTVRACLEGSADIDCEVVVGDDASTDASVAQVERQFRSVRVVRHEERRGVSPTRHMAAREARGETFLFFDGHCKPEPGAIRRLVESVERTGGDTVITPKISALDVPRWENAPQQSGHGYRLELERFDCGWLPLLQLRRTEIAGQTFYESPAMIGCAVAMGRPLYEALWGFDPNMCKWGVEDLDFSLKCWLSGRRILHDPQAVVGHRFRATFDNYDAPIDHFLVNQLRMAWKNFTPGVWDQWLDRARQRYSGQLSEHPEGLWARVWAMFLEGRDSADRERAHLHARRVRDEFWYAERFGLPWPRLAAFPGQMSPGRASAPGKPAHGAANCGTGEVDPSPSPAPSLSPSPGPSPAPSLSPSLAPSPSPAINRARTTAATTHRSTAGETTVRSSPTIDGRR